MRPILLLPLLGAFGCFFDSNAEGSGSELGSSSDSSGSGTDGGSDSESEGVTDGGSTETSSASGGAESGTWGGSSDTGAAATDYALRFGGSSSVLSTEVLVWDTPNVTIEAWVDLRSGDAAGDLVDLQQASPSGGWALQIGPSTHVLTFVMHGASGDLDVLEGPSTEEIGTGWHHVAAVRHDTMARLFVDGQQVASRSVDAPLGPAEVKLALGHSPTAGSAWSLRDATLDDVMVTDDALYDGPFDPPSHMDPSEAVVSLSFDEGEGAMTTDAAGLIFVVTDASWVPGYKG